MASTRFWILLILTVVVASLSIEDPRTRKKIQSPPKSDNLMAMESSWMEVLKRSGPSPSAGNLTATETRRMDVIKKAKSSSSVDNLMASESSKIKVINREESSPRADNLTASETRSINVKTIRLPRNRVIKATVEVERKSNSRLRNVSKHNRGANVANSVHARSHRPRPHKMSIRYLAHGPQRLKTKGTFVAHLTPGRPAHRRNTLAPKIFRPVTSAPTPTHLHSPDVGKQDGETHTTPGFWNDTVKCEGEVVPSTRSNKEGKLAERNKTQFESKVENNISTSGLSRKSPFRSMEKHSATSRPPDLFEKPSRFGSNITSTPGFAKKSSLGSLIGHNRTHSPSNVTERPSKLGSITTAMPKFSKNSLLRPMNEHNGKHRSSYLSKKPSTVASNITPTPVFSNKSSLESMDGHNGARKSLDMSEKLSKFGFNVTSTPEFSKNSLFRSMNEYNGTHGPSDVSEKPSSFGSNITSTPKFSKKSPLGSMHEQNRTQKPSKVGSNITPEKSSLRYMGGHTRTYRPSDLSQKSKKNTSSLDQRNMSDKRSSLGIQVKSKTKTEISNVGKEFGIISNISTFDASISSVAVNETHVKLSILLDRNMFDNGKRYENSSCVSCKKEVSVVEYLQPDGNVIYNVSINPLKVSKYTTGQRVYLMNSDKNIHKRNTRSNHKEQLYKKKQPLPCETSNTHNECTSSMHSGNIPVTQFTQVARNGRGNMKADESKLIPRIFNQTNLSYGQGNMVQPLVLESHEKQSVEHAKGLDILAPQSNKLGDQGSAHKLTPLDSDKVNNTQVVVPQGMAKPYRGNVLEVLNNGTKSKVDHKLYMFLEGNLTKGNVESNDKELRISTESIRDPLEPENKEQNFTVSKNQNVTSNFALTSGLAQHDYVYYQAPIDNTNKSNTDAEYWNKEAEKFSARSGSVYTAVEFNVSSADIPLHSIGNHEELEVKNASNKGSTSVGVPTVITSALDTTISVEETLSNLMAKNSTELNVTRNPNGEQPETVNATQNVLNMLNETRDHNQWLIDYINKTKAVSDLLGNLSSVGFKEVNDTFNSTAERPSESGKALIKLVNNFALSSIPASVNIQKGLNESNLKTVVLNEKVIENAGVSSQDHDIALERKSVVPDLPTAEDMEVHLPYEPSLDSSVFLERGIEEEPSIEEFYKTMPWDTYPSYIESRFPSFLPYEIEEHDPKDYGGILDYRFPDGIPYAVEHSYDLDEYRRMLMSFLGSYSTALPNTVKSAEARVILDEINKLINNITSGGLSRVYESSDNDHGLKTSSHEYRTKFEDFDGKVSSDVTVNGDNVHARDNYNYEDFPTHQTPQRTILLSERGKTLKDSNYASKDYQVKKTNEQSHRFNTLTGTKTVSDITNGTQSRTTASGRDSFKDLYNVPFPQNNYSIDPKDTEHLKPHDKFSNKVHVNLNDINSGSNTGITHSRQYLTSSGYDFSGNKGPQILGGMEEPTSILSVNTMDLNRSVVSFNESDMPATKKHPVEDIVNPNEKLYSDPFHVDLTESMLNPNSQLYRDHVYTKQSFPKDLNKNDKSNIMESEQGNLMESLEEGRRTTKNGNVRLNMSESRSTYNNNSKDVAEDTISQVELLKTNISPERNVANTKGYPEDMAEEDVSRKSDEEGNRPGRVAGQGFTVQLEEANTAASVETSDDEYVDITEIEDQDRGTEQNTKEDDLPYSLNVRGKSYELPMEDTESDGKIVGSTKGFFALKAMNDIVNSSSRDIMKTNPTMYGHFYDHISENVNTDKRKLVTNDTLSTLYDEDNNSGESMHQTWDTMDGLSTDLSHSTTQAVPQEDKKDTELLTSVIVPLEMDRNEYTTINLAKDKPVVSLVFNNITILYIVVGHGQMEIHRMKKLPENSGAIKSSIILPVKLDPQGPGYLNFSFVDNQPTVSVMVNQSMVDQFPLLGADA